VGTVNVAFAASFFTTPAGTARFGLTAAQIPVELATPPSLLALAGIPPVPGDVLFYIMSTSEAAVAAFESGLSATHGSAISADSLERGFQRHDGREQFGFRDGLRNIPASERPAVVFVDPDRSPEEPAWTAGGSYVAYLKIRQDLDAMKAKTEGEQEQIIGRRKSDGSRLDLPPGTHIAQEGPFESDTCPVSTHIRKAGPRGELHDQTAIFRRGVPYLTLNPDGTEDAGLQFVSYQRSLAEFAVIFARWMTNPHFLHEGTGSDALLASGVITIEKAGFFFTPPRDPRYVGAPIFDPPPPDPCATGRIVVQKESHGRQQPAGALGAGRDRIPGQRRQRSDGRRTVRHRLHRAGDLPAPAARHRPRRARGLPTTGVPAGAGHARHPDEGAGAGEDRQPADPGRPRARVQRVAETGSPCSAAVSVRAGGRATPTMARRGARGSVLAVG
jgi:Dyp-type peroxidase family